MRILFLSINYWPEQTGIAPVNTWRCEYLAAQGHDVTMCTSFPYYPEWRVAEGYRGRLWQREIRNGVEIRRSWMWVPRVPSAIKRIVFEASFLLTTFVSALITKSKTQTHSFGAGHSANSDPPPTGGGSVDPRPQRPDLLYIVSPPLGLALTARLLSWWWGVPYVFDVMDLQPDAAADLGMLRDGFLVRLLFALERMAYRNAALVTTLNDGMRQRIVGKGVPEEKVKLFPAKADERLFGLRDATNGANFRRIYGLEDRFLVLHSGAMGVKQGLEVVLEAAKLTQNDPKIAFLIVGDGAARPLLQRKSADLGLKNVLFLPVQPAEVYPEMLAAADIALVTQQKTVSDIVFPSKTVSYLAAGCPVIASVNPESEIARVITTSGAGVVIPAEDPQALADALRAMLKSPGALSVMTQLGTAYARKHWDGARILPYIESELARVAGADGAKAPQNGAESRAEVVV